MPDKKPRGRPRGSKNRRTHSLSVPTQRDLQAEQARHERELLIDRIHATYDAWKARCEAERQEVAKQAEARRQQQEMIKAQKQLEQGDDGLLYHKPRPEPGSLTGRG